ncbi:MAG TPA: alpha-ketoglutarate-dependent dioxygenase AlkB [Terriglobia bacterium]|nr:alpha-ketoglutarate-dependent dioxygenase AlkB [Terriglobia bacterium]
MSQRKLFPAALPPGLVCRADFISPQEEAELLAEIGQLPLVEAKYKEFTARRRIVSYGGTYDFSSNELLPTGPIPPFLLPLRERVAAWAGVPAALFTHALIAEYKTGTPLGWHRDVPDFEIVAGISLAGAGRMRLRRYPHVKGRRETLSLDLEPRSAYLLRGEARWGWQHSIPPTKNLRYSITLRTRAGEAKLQ